MTDYTDREKWPDEELIDLLLNDFLYEHKTGQTLPTVSRAIDESLRRMHEPKWISVDDRFPELDVQVIGWNGIFSHIYQYEGEYWINLSVDGDIGGGTHVTHWLPLPEPPK